MLNYEHLLVVCAFVCSLVVGGCSGADGDDIVVDIAQGKLVGELRTSFSGMPYGAFEGIPYARSPVGKRRFRVCSIFYVIISCDFS